MTKDKRQNTNNKLICHFLIGLPGSGKSTFARKLKEIIIDAVIVSTDTIRQQLYGDESIQGDWAEIEQEVLQQIVKAIAARKSVIYDATNVHRDWRTNILAKTQAKLTTDAPSIYWIAWHLQTPLDLCKQWNQTRAREAYPKNRQVPEQIIEQYAQILQHFPPVQQEGFMQIYQVIATNNLTINQPDYQIEYSNI